MRGEELRDSGARGGDELDDVLGEDGLNYLDYADGR